MKTVIIKETASGLVTLKDVKEVKTKKTVGETGTLTSKLSYLVTKANFIIF